MRTSQTKSYAANYQGFGRLVVSIHPPFRLAHVHADVLSTRVGEEDVVRPVEDRPDFSLNVRLNVREQVVQDPLQRPTLFAEGP